MSNEIVLDSRTPDYPSPRTIPELQVAELMIFRMEESRAFVALPLVRHAGLVTSSARLPESNAINAGVKSAMRAKAKRCLLCGSRTIGQASSKSKQLAMKISSASDLLSLLVKRIEASLSRTNAKPSKQGEWFKRTINMKGILFTSDRNQAYECLHLERLADNSASTLVDQKEYASYNAVCMNDENILEASRAWKEFVERQGDSMKSFDVSIPFSWDLFSDKVITSKRTSSFNEYEHSDCSCLNHGPSASTEDVQEQTINLLVHRIMLALKQQGIEVTEDLIVKTAAAAYPMILCHSGSPRNSGSSAPRNLLVRLASLTRIQCPRFHADKTRLRSLASLVGAGPVALSEAGIIRHVFQEYMCQQDIKLNPNSYDIMMKKLFMNPYDPESAYYHAAAGNVLFMKGTTFEPDGYQFALLHRSPNAYEVGVNPRRVLLQIDDA